MQDTPLFAPEPPPEPETLSVRGLAQRFTQMLKREFREEVWVVGEIRNLSRSARGHVYFNLVEPPPPGEAPTASISVVLFDSTKKIINRRLTRSGAGRIEDGMEIRIRAAVDYYIPQGSLQLRMTAIDPEYTLGRLAADRDRILRVLAEEGLLEANSQYELPLVPLRIALITSARSAAAADFNDELARSGFNFDVSLYDSRVQGDAAAESLQRAVIMAGETDVDVVVIVRGGGSRTDLAVFDNETLARTIAACPLPVVVGIGHEIDRSIADAVAHTSLKTPTACGNLLVERVRATDQRFAQLGRHIAALAHQRPTEVDFALHVLARRVVGASESALAAATQRTTHIARVVRQEATAGHTRANTRLVNAAARLQPATRASLRAATLAHERHAARLVSSAPRVIRQHEQTLENHAALVRSLDPVQTLRRGFSITTDSSGRLVRSIADVDPTEPTQLVTRLPDGTVASTVTGKVPRAAAQDGQNT